MTKKIIRSFLWALALLYLLPLLVIFTNSFMRESEIERNYGNSGFMDEFHYADYNLIPEKVTLEQYKALLFESPKYLDYFLNSVKLSAPIVLMQLVMGTLAGYAFAFGRFRFKEILFCVYITVMLLPFQATSVANFIIAEKLGILESYLALILPLGFSPFPVFIMRQSMRGIDIDIINAARLDGASEGKILMNIAVPTAQSGLISVFMLSFCECWGMVEHAAVFIREAENEPLSLFLSEMGNGNVGLIFAASVFYMLPAVWVFVHGLPALEQSGVMSV